MLRTSAITADSVGSFMVDVSPRNLLLSIQKIILLSRELYLCTWGLRLDQLPEQRRAIGPEGREVDEHAQHGVKEVELRSGSHRQHAVLHRWQRRYDVHGLRRAFRHQKKHLGSNITDAFEEVGKLL